MSDYYTLFIYDIFYIIIIIIINITILNTRGYRSHQETALRYLDEDFLKESLELAKTAGIDEVRYLLLRFEVEMPWKFHQESP